jgi:dimethylargininase
VSPRIAECEISYVPRQPIDVARAALQHDEYERRLAAHGCSVIHAADALEMPDGVFVEDAALVLDDVAIITRPGAPSRRSETESVAATLERYRPLRRIEAPATLDGGDVLIVGETLYVGLSQRTNLATLQQLDAVPINFQNCLHLKSALTLIGDRTLLLNPEWVDAAQFDGFNIIAIDPHEPHAANALRLDDALLYSSSYPRTRAILESYGFNVETTDMSELEKAEGGVTCCSIIFSELPRRSRRSTPAAREEPSTETH